MNFGCSKEEEEVPETAIQKKTRRGGYECWCGFVLLHDGMVLYIGQAMVGRSKKRSIRVSTQTTIWDFFFYNL